MLAMRHKLTALLPILLAVLLLGGGLAAWVLSTTQQQDALPQGRNSNAGKGTDAASRNPNDPITSTTPHNNTTDPTGRNPTATSTPNNSSAHPTPSPTSPGTRDQNSNPSTAPDPTNANNTTNTTPPHKPKNPNVPDPATLNPLDVTELEISIPVKLDATLYLLRANSPEESSPFQVFAVLACHDRGPPLNGWRFVEDRARTVDAEGKRLDPDPTRNLPRSLYEPRPGEVAVVSRSDLSPLYAHAFPELAKILDDAGTLMAFPAEFQEALKDEAGNYTEPHSIRTELPFYARGPKTFSMDIQVSQLFVAMAAAGRGEWTIHLFGFRDQPPKSLKLGTPEIEPKELGPWLVTFPQIETSLAEVTGGRTIDIRGQFKHHATGVGAPLAGVKSLQLIVAEADDSDVEAAANDKPEESKPEADQGDEEEDPLRVALHALTSPRVVAIEVATDGSFRSCIPRLIRGNESDSNTPPIDWWPPLIMEHEDYPRGLWFANVMGGAPIGDRTEDVKRLKHLMELAARNEIGAGESLIPLKDPAWEGGASRNEFFDGRDPHYTLSETQSEEYGDVDAKYVGPLYEPMHLVLPSAKFADGTLDFGEIFVGGTLLEIELEVPAPPLPVPLEALNPIPLKLSVHHHGRWGDPMCHFFAKDFPRAQPGGVLRLLVPGHCERIDTGQHYDRSQEAELSVIPNGFYGSAIWRNSGGQSPKAIRIRVPAMAQALREVRILPDAASGDYDLVSVAICGTVLPSSVVPTIVSSALSSEDIWNLSHPPFELSGVVFSEVLTDLSESLYIPVPRPSEIVTAYWVVVYARGGFHPRAVYCDIRDRDPLVISMTPTSSVTINVRAPDALGNVHAGDDRPSYPASQSKDAQLADWNGLYYVTMVLYRMDDGIEAVSSSWTMDVGSSRQVSIKVPSKVNLRVVVRVSGYGFDIGKRSPEQEVVLMALDSSENGEERSHDSSNPTVADATIAIAYPTYFSLWEWADNPSPRTETQPRRFGQVLLYEVDGLNSGLLRSPTEDEHGRFGSLSGFPHAIDSPEWREIGGFPTHLRIQGNRVPLTRTDSVDEKGKRSFKLSLNLISNVHVIVRNLKPGAKNVMVYGQTLSDFDCQGKPDQESFVAKLWLPHGRAWISLGYYDPRFEDRRIEVPADGVLTVELDANEIAVQDPIENPESE